MEAPKKMGKEHTLSIIKPDGIGKNIVGEIISRLEKGGLQIIATKMLQMNKDQAEGFYSIHRERPFFNDLVTFMSSGPVLVMVLEGENAILKNRDLMGSTDPKQAASGTIRADFAQNIDKNIVHGSDAADTANTEITFFFSKEEIYSRACLKQ